jgi:hypothetical protein
MTTQPALSGPSVASAASKGIAFFLRINSTMQSYLHVAGERHQASNAPHFRTQQAKSLAAFGLLILASTVAGLSGNFSEATQAVLLGASFPGAGFLTWGTPDQLLLAISCTVIGLLSFGASLLFWFGTGNLLAPLACWIALACLAGWPRLTGLAPEPVTSGWPFALAPALWTALGLAWIRPAKARPLPVAIPTPKRTWAIPAETSDELSLEYLQRQRLLLDRALQPVDEFNGFEWRDQFQTAAMRYQVNFIAYALAIARHRYTPAADAYLAEAQTRLLTKIGDRRLWGYWQLENAWGHLRLNADPVIKENIMFSGFTALQMAVSGHDGPLILHEKGKEWRRYSRDQLVALLDAQYRSSRSGLLACEPNWVYPLCNLITAAGMKAADARTGTTHWQGIAAGFRQSLEREATRSDGSFIAFRSTLTGIAPPAPGGIVMQAFPCLFLNCLDPDLAQQHWQRVRLRLAGQNWSRLFWPVDVGNYGLSRASSFAATAAAAVELGDAATAQECLQRLEAACPSTSEGGVIHRARASLWAHALEQVARCGGQDGLRSLIEAPHPNGGPRLDKASYPDILVARAQSRGDTLMLSLYPSGGCATPWIELAGLLPHRHYHTGLGDQPFLRADGNGRAVMMLSLRGRTSLTITPVI